MFEEKNCECTESVRCLLHISFERLIMLEKQLDLMKTQNDLLKQSLKKEKMEKNRLNLEVLGWQASYLAEISRNKE